MTGFVGLLDEALVPISDTNPLPVTLAGGGGAAVQVQDTAGTTGGYSVYNNTALTNTKVQVKSGAATLYGASFVSGIAAGGAVTYIQAFDALSASVTLGTTPPTAVFWVPGGGAWEEKFASVGIAFSTGLVIAATTTATGSSAPASAVLAQVEYK